MSSFPLIFALIFGGVFLMAAAGFGGYLLFNAFRGGQKTNASKNWRPTTGTITQSHVREGFSRDKEGESAPVFYPSVTYRYTVDGVSYQGVQIALGSTPAFRQQKSAMEVTLKYPPGSEVPMFYDPKNPEESVLERSAKGSALGLVFGIALLIVALCIASSLVVALLRSLLFPFLQ